MSSALSITRAVNPPRAVYLDYPLGHTAGKPDDPDNQMAIMQDTLIAFAEISEPGGIVELDYQWRDDDSWKDYVMRPRPKSGNETEQHADDRVERHDTPQYQSVEDESAAQADCPSCVFLEDAR